MAQTFQGPVTVEQAGVARTTVIGVSSVLVGRAAPTAGGGGFPGIDLPIKFPGQVVIDPGKNDKVVGEHAPAVPAVNVDIGDLGGAGGLTARDEGDRAVISLNGRTGLCALGTGQGAAGQLMLRSDKNGPVILMTGKDGRITFMDGQLKQTLVIDAVRGDIELIGADCAEDFEVAEPATPGSVLTLSADGLLRPCRRSYDQRVVGVVSGAGGYRPGLVLGRGRSDGSRQPLALVGKAFCLVDADCASIGIGDLLTTSETEGHAMRATGPGPILRIGPGQEPRGARARSGAAARPRLAAVKAAR
jgi:hypothetical protein